MESFFRFMTSRTGRAVRIVIGLLLMLIGLSIGFNTGDFIGWVITVLGVFPLAAGIFDLCLIAPFFGKSYKGSDLRAQVGSKVAE